MTCEIPTQQRAKAPRPPIMDAPTGRRPHDAQHALALFLPHPPRPDHHLRERAGRARGRIRRGAACWRPTELSNRCATELLEYFAGKRVAFDVPLDPEGTEFQKSVWEALSRVPFATSVTSGDIAHKLGKPKSYRAVGAAVRENPLAVIVPDHRVVRANGRPIAADARGRIREGLLHMEQERAGA